MKKIIFFIILFIPLIVLANDRLEVTDSTQLFDNFKFFNQKGTIYFVDNGYIIYNSDQIIKYNQTTKDKKIINRLEDGIDEIFHKTDSYVSEEPIKNSEIIRATVKDQKLTIYYYDKDLNIKKTLEYDGITTDCNGVKIFQFNNRIAVLLSNTQYTSTNYYYEFLFDNNLNYITRKNNALSSIYYENNKDYFIHDLEPYIFNDSLELVHYKGIYYDIEYVSTNNYNLSKYNNNSFIKSITIEDTSYPEVTYINNKVFVKLDNNIIKVYDNDLNLIKTLDYSKYDEVYVDDYYGKIYFTFNIDYNSMQANFVFEMKEDYSFEPVNSYDITYRFPSSDFEGIERNFNFPTPDIGYNIFNYYKTNSSSSEVFDVIELNNKFYVPNYIKDNTNNVVTIKLDVFDSNGNYLSTKQLNNLDNAHIANITSLKYGNKLIIAYNVSRELTEDNITNEKKLLLYDPTDDSIEDCTNIIPNGERNMLLYNNNGIITAIYSKGISDARTIYNGNIAEINLSGKNSDSRQVYYYELSTSYEQKVIENVGGVVTVSKEYSLPGQEIEISITPNEGYKVKNIIVKDANGNIIEVNNNKYIAPSTKTTIEVEYEKELTNPFTGLQIPLSFSLLFILGIFFYLISKNKTIYKI